MKFSRIVLSIALGLLSLLGLAAMLMGDEKVIILPNQSPGPELVLGLQWYFWGFAVVLLFVSIAMMMVDREDEKEETLTVLSPSEPPKR